MTDVTLVLKANNSDYVNKMKEAQAVSQKVYDTVQTGSQMEMGIIEKLQAQYTNLQKYKKEAYSVDDIAKYNQELEKTKGKLNDLDQAGLETKKQTVSLTESIGKWALGLGVVTTAISLLKSALEKTQQGMIIFSQAGAAMNQVLSNIVNGVSDWSQGVAQAIILAKQMALLKIQEKEDSIEINTLFRDYNRLYSEGIDATISLTDRMQKLSAAKQKYIEATNLEIAAARSQLAVVVEQWKNDPSNMELEGKAIDLKNKILDLQGLMEEGTRRLTRQITAAEKTMWDGVLTAEKDFDKELGKAIEDNNKFIEDEQKKANEDKLKLDGDYYKAANALIDKYNSLNIESLTGVDKLKAQRDFALGEIDALKTKLNNASLLAGLGPLTDDQQNMILKMVDDVQKVFIKGMEKEAKLTPEEKAAISKGLLAGIPTLADATLRPMGDIITKRTTPLSSIWELFGIDPNSVEGKKEIEAIHQVADTTMKMLDDTFKNKVDDAKRNRELLDTKISEAESELNSETELYKAGYASNVDAKKKEVADLKIQRDIALKNEEDAVKRQRTLDTITQLVNLITSSTEIFKTMSKIPIIGIPLAIGMIGAMFAAFASAKVKASAAVGYAKGGWTGEGLGYRDGQGDVAGTVHRREYVVREGPAYKFRSVLDAINRDDRRLAFNRFNKLTPGTTINNVVVENDGPNKRLDKLIQLNKKQSKEDIIELGNRTIIRKGNVTRTIKRD